MRPATTAQIAETRIIASDVRLITLRFPDGDPIPFEIGGHLDIDVPIGGGIQTRSYSLVAPAAGGVQIAVKLMPDSRGGSRYLWSLGDGARLTVRPARNNLPLGFGGARYVLIAGGIGITPLVAMGPALMRAGKPVQMHYTMRDAADAPFVDSLRQALGDRLTIHDNAAGTILDCQALVDGLAPDTVVYMCGPMPLMEAVNRAWHARGLPVANLRFETFGNSGRMPSEPFRVTVRETGASITVARDQSMLDALLAAGQPVMFECRRGECGLCKVEIETLEGRIDHRDVFLSEHERQAGSAMCCCVSRVHGGHVTIRIDGITHGRMA